MPAVKGQINVNRNDQDQGPLAPLSGLPRELFHDSFRDLHCLGGMVMLIQIIIGPLKQDHVLKKDWSYLKQPPQKREFHFLVSRRAPLWKKSWFKTSSGFLFKLSYRELVKWGKDTKVSWSCSFIINLGLSWHELTSLMRFLIDNKFSTSNE